MINRGGRDQVYQVSFTRKVLSDSRKWLTLDCALLDLLRKTTLSQISLTIEINEKDSLAVTLRQFNAEVVGCHGFADAAFVVRDGEDLCAASATWADTLPARKVFWRDRCDGILVIVPRVSDIVDVTHQLNAIHQVHPSGARLSHLVSRPIEVACCDHKRFCACPINGWSASHPSHDRNSDELIRRKPLAFDPSNDSLAAGQTNLQVYPSEKVWPHLPSPITRPA